MKTFSKVSLSRDATIATSYTAGSGLGVGGIAAACNTPFPEVMFMVGTVVAAGCVISYVKRIDRVKESE